ncbi:ABC transporter substrate-binding protein [Microbacterium sp. XT11]|uniref:ABC transporter substrate-binding protein n=1 Tax=Microbacterium sp. XT11 TaxID=367477 RepID=UPI000743078F|nr:sugar ABC transporter substrate-binding protein [Microbacterium sp. XT11]ALX66426.1 extracellular solute-binding protein family 1 protein [Microbacterium sp. XT11]
MNTRALRVGAFATALTIGGVGLAACAPSGSGGGSDAGEKVTLTFANADPAETWDLVIKAFEKSHPNIAVKQLNIPYAQYTSTINQRMTGGGGDIDVMVVDAGGAVLDWAKRGFLADISDLKEDAVAAALSEDMVTAREADGKLYALETWTTSQFLYYNVDILAAAGIEPPVDDPAQPWTYEELTAAAQKIKDAGAAEYPFLFDQWDSYYQLQMVGVSAGGGDGIDAEGNVDFSNEGWQKALTWYHDLFEDGLSPRGITNDKNGALFQTGKAGFMISGPWGVNVAEAGDITYGVAPAPYFEGGEAATSTDSWSVAISAKTAKKDAAREFLEYLTIDPTGNAESAEVAGIAPTNKEAYAKYAEKMSALGGEATANFGAIMQYQLENNAVHRPGVVGYSVFEPGANQMFSDIRNGSDPAERAAQADEDIEAQIARLK